MPLCVPIKDLRDTAAFDEMVSSSSSLLVERAVGRIDAQRVRRRTMGLGLFIRSHLVWFQSFDHVIVYYDRGQKQLTRALKLSLLANLANAEFRVAHPDKYKLFQVADLVCTLESLRIKLAEKRLSRSETEFFRSGKRLKRNYFKWLEAKRIDS